MARFFEASTMVDLGEFRQFTAYLTENRAIQGWSGSPWSPRPRGSAIRSRAQATGERLLEIWERGRDGRRIPASGRDRYYPILYVNPMAGNEGALGYDLGSEPVRARPSSRQFIPDCQLPRTRPCRFRQRKCGGICLSCGPYSMKVRRIRWSAWRQPWFVRRSYSELQPPTDRPRWNFPC